MFRFPARVGDFRVETMTPDCDASISWAGLGVAPDWDLMMGYTNSSSWHGLLIYAGDVVVRLVGKLYASKRPLLVDLSRAVQLSARQVVLDNPLLGSFGVSLVITMGYHAVHHEITLNIDRASATTKLPTDSSLVIINILLSLLA